MDWITFKIILREIFKELGMLILIILYGILLSRGQIAIEETEGKKEA